MKVQSKAESTIDYDKLLANEQLRLERVKAAYQNGIDTLEEYKRNKEQIYAFMEKIKAEMKANGTRAAAADNAGFRQKAANVLKIIKDPSQPENAKNIALRSIVERIVFKKPENEFDIFFYV